MRIITGGQTKPVEGWPGYYVTDQGDVLTTRSNSGNADKPPRKMKPYPNKSGHMRVTLSNRGKTKSVYVHHLVLEAFVGPRPQGLMGCHRNGDPSNNKVSNLKWDTSSGNRLDMWDHGTMPHGSKLHSSKLTEDQVVEMRERFSIGDIDVQDLAKTYGVDPTTIGSALRGEWWGHVGGPIVKSCRPSGNRHWRRRGRRNEPQ